MSYVKRDLSFNNETETILECFLYIPSYFFELFFRDIKNNNNNTSKFTIGDWVIDGTEDKSEFEYDRSEKGPGRWGDLSEEWTLCKTGKMQ